MNIINTTVKNRIIEILMQNQKGLGVYTIAKLAQVSVSEVWRQIPVLIKYGLVKELVKGFSGKRKKYQINMDNPLSEAYKKLQNHYQVINSIIDLTPAEAIKRLLKRYYITGTYIIKEMSWDLCYPDGFMVAIDPNEYTTADLIKNSFINRWNFIIIIKKDISNCDFNYDEIEGINKATNEQAVADSIANYELDPNNIEILYFLLVEDLDWKKLVFLINTQWGDLALYRIYYLFSLARILGGQLYPTDIFHPKEPIHDISKFTQDAQASCFRILLCNGVTQKQAW